MSSLWTFLTGRRRQQQPQPRASPYNLSRLAPPPRAKDEVSSLMENQSDLGATIALRQIIAASGSQPIRSLSSHTTQFGVRTMVSGISSDSEDYILNEFSDSGRRAPRSGPIETPVVVSPPSSENSLGGEDIVDVRIEGDGAQSVGSKFLRDPVGTLLHLTLAATIVSGPPGGQYITSGPPPPEQRGRAPHIRSEPLPPALITRPRAVSSPIRGDRSQTKESGAIRSARTL